MNQLLLYLRSKRESIRAKAAPQAADKLEELRNSLTEYMNVLDAQKHSDYIKMWNRAKKALGIK